CITLVVLPVQKDYRENRGKLCELLVLFLYLEGEGVMGVEQYDNTHQHKNGVDGIMTGVMGIEDYDNTHQHKNGVDGIMTGVMGVEEYDNTHQHKNGVDDIMTGVMGVEQYDNTHQHKMVLFLMSDC
ncbi:hypothetical protein STEG23_002522, partial [Scotinomys teguina]